MFLIAMRKTPRIRRFIELAIAVVVLLLINLAGCTHAPDRAVTIRVISHTVPIGDQLSIAGSIDEFGKWKPGTILLAHTSDTVWERTFALKRGTIVLYRITRGSWRTEALDERGPQYAGIKDLEVGGDTTILLRLDRWIGTAVSPC